jgi:hypothetical protein
MNAKTFYHKAAARSRFLIPESSDDSQLEGDNGNDDEYVQPVVNSSSSTGDENDSDTNDNEDLESREPSGSSQAQSKKKEVRRLPIWKEGKLDSEIMRKQFQGDESLSAEYLLLATPLQYFTKLFSVELMQLIVEQSNLYCTQSRPEKPLQLSVDELRSFLGVVLWMSLIKLRNSRLYWNPRFTVEAVTNIMANNRFEEIKHYLHFDDNSVENDDSLRKVRPVVSMVRNALVQVPKEESLSIDEQIVPFKGRSRFKQYNPKKPHRWGYKCYVLSGVSGFAYDFEVFTGAQHIVQTNEVDCGASSNVVIRMCRTVTEGVGHKVYFDNYFTSMRLLSFMEGRSIQCVGTVRPNRLPGVKGPTEKEMKKCGRGSVHELITTVDGVDISYVRWYDNRVVNIVSTFVGSEPLTRVRRWCRKEKVYTDIDCPQVITVYNKHMGGVDLLDSLMGLYRIQLRSKKWYHKLFFHCVDMAVVNAWLLFRRSLNQQGKEQSVIPLAEFKAQVAEGIIYVQQLIMNLT